MPPSGAAGDGHDLARHVSAARQFGQHGRNAARPVQVLHVMPPGRRQLAQVGRDAAYFIKNFQSQRQSRFGEHGGQMQHGIGAAAQGHIHGHGVAHGFFRHDVARAQVLFHQSQNLLARLLGQTDARGGHGGYGSVARQSKAYGFGQAVHGVGREHAGT